MSSDTRTVVPDLMAFDPSTLYEFERQLRAATGDAYFTFSYNTDDNRFHIGIYGTKPEWHHICTGYSETIIGAVRECGEQLAAPQQNQEEDGW